MRPATTRAGNRRYPAFALVTCLLVPPALAAPAEALFAVVPAVLAALAAVGSYPAGPVTLSRAAAAGAAVSLLGDLGFLLTREGLDEVKWALPWLPFELLALLVLLPRVVRGAPARRAVVLGTLTALAAVLLPLRFSLRNSHDVLEQSVLGGVCAAFAVLIAGGIGLRRRVLDHRGAEAIDRARREQRLHVARDLHDFVAHEVTGMLLETQAAQLADYDETRTKELLGRLEAAGQRALASMDETLRVLREPGTRPEPPPTRVRGLGDLAVLLRRFEGAGHPRTTLDLERGLAGTLPPEAEDAAYRLVVEALTNIRRHAPGAHRVRVEAARTGGCLRVAVFDDARPGTGPTRAPRAAGGTGLLALTERFEGLRGSVVAGPGADGGSHAGPGAGPARGTAGWTVVGVLPLDGAVT